MEATEARLTAAEGRLEAIERAQASKPAPATNTSHERFVAVAAAAARLGVSGRTVRRLIEGGELQGRKLTLPGRRRQKWAVSTVALERLIGPLDGSPAAPAASIDAESGAAHNK